MFPILDQAPHNFAQSYRPRTTQNIYDTEYIISKCRKRQKETRIDAPPSYTHYAPNKYMCLTPSGPYPTEELRKGRQVHCGMHRIVMIFIWISQVYLTRDFTYNLKGTFYTVKKGSLVTIISDFPVTVHKVL